MEAVETGDAAREHLDAANEGRLIREDGERGGDTTDERQQIIEQAAAGVAPAKALNDEQKTDALAWLLADDAEVGEDSRTETWEFNVGTEEQQVWIDWTIRPVDADSMNALRQRARGRQGLNRASRRRGGEENFDVTAFNLFMVAHATVSPDLAFAAEQKGVNSADPLYGPVELLKHQFRNKPGIVDQIAAKVMLFSGYDEEDARRATPEAVMVRAAGNS